ncbi:Kelch-like protein 8 [Nymphon striatum]|nr:Kelch-like protein 8 [Nymphon striatum]
MRIHYVMDERIERNKVYVIGGESKDAVGPLDTTFCYTTETNMWTTEKNLPEKRSFAAACSVGNKVYLSGGCLPDPSNRRSTLSEKLEVYQYDTDHKTWTKLTELINRRSEHTMAAINKELYIVGGKGPKSSCEKIDLNSKIPNAIRIAGMKEERSQHSMDVCNEVLYVAGGCNNGVELQSVEKYDPKSYIWTTMQNNLLSARRMAQMVNLHQNLIIIGGINGMEHLNLIESCLSGDEEMDWTYETRFLKKVIFHGVLVCGFSSLALRKLESKKRFISCEEVPATRHTYDLSSVTKLVLNLVLTKPVFYPGLTWGNPTMIHDEIIVGRMKYNVPL